MFDNNAFIISFGLAASITLMYVLSNKNEDNDKKSNIDKIKPVVSIFSIIFVVIYMICVLILDGSDNTDVYNNIKVGEPPF
jgi:hypothetical protein|tara:strand:- start:2117 stop:2359 length:243 start_codon:yes stop_codon:yes gene_type:complete